MGIFDNLEDDIKDILSNQLDIMAIQTVSDLAMQRASKTMSDFAAEYSNHSVAASQVAKTTKKDTMSTIWNYWPTTVGCFVGWIFRDLCDDLDNIKLFIHKTTEFGTMLQSSLILVDLLAQDLTGTLRFFLNPLVDHIIDLITFTTMSFYGNIDRLVSKTISEIFDQDKCSDNPFERCLPIEEIGRLGLSVIHTTSNKFEKKLRSIIAVHTADYVSKTETLSKLNERSKWIDVHRFLASTVSQLKQLDSLSTSTQLDHVINRGLEESGANMLWDNTNNKYIPVFERVALCGCEINIKTNNPEQLIIPEDPENLMFRVYIRLSS